VISPFINPPCPLLPELSGDIPLPITHTRKHRLACDRRYFQSCLELAHSLWRSGLPAQAILQLDKSMMVSDDSPSKPLHYPYSAILWIIQHAPPNQFLGNPVRHFQHLASRMNPKLPNSSDRIWRAWACLHLTEIYIPEATSLYPRDRQQISREKLSIPTIDQILNQLDEPFENRLLQSLFQRTSS